MKNTIGKRILTVIFIPFSLLAVILSFFAANAIAQYFINRAELELKGISDINAAQLGGKIDSVSITVLRTAMVLEKVNSKALDSREQVDDHIRTMFLNRAVYNAWVAYEPNAFDGKDAEHTTDYPGAPSGRLLISYVIEDGKIIMAPDMNEETIDNTIEAPWYAVPRNEDRLYVDAANNVNENLYDYGVGGSKVYTLSVAAPVHRDGRVIGCVGADVLLDTMTFGIDNAKNATVAAFYSDGRVLYAENTAFAEDSVSTLGFTSSRQILETMDDNGSLFLSNEACDLLKENSFAYLRPVIFEGMSSSIFLFVALPRSDVLGELEQVLLLVAGVGMIIIAVWVFVFLYINRKISKPVMALTLSADAISQGNLEAEIPFFPDSQGEIGMLSSSLRRMVEQFRVYIAKQNQVYEETALRALINATLMKTDVSAAYQSLAVMLCRHFGITKVTIVLLTSGKAKIAARYEVGVAPQLCDFTEDFIYHNQVMSLLSPNRKLVFLNSYGIKMHKVPFVDKATAGFCLLTLKDDNDLYGYIIYESSSKRSTFSTSTESALLYISRILTDWISEEKWKTVATDDGDEDESAEGGGEAGAFPARAAEASARVESGFISALRNIEGLFVDTALETLGGLQNIYENSVRLFARTGPESARKLDEYIDGDDFAAFAIEVHGIKGALNNIGAAELGVLAARLETEAKNNNSDYCAEHYPRFRASLISLCRQLKEVAVEDAPDSRAAGSMVFLKAELAKTSEAVERYDCVEALEIITTATAYTYGQEIDGILKEIANTLEQFDCESAQDEINKLGGMIDGV